MIVFDSEIKNMILGRNERPQPGVRYCNGWSDYEGMGISVVCAYDLDTGMMHTLHPQDDVQDASLLKILFSRADYIVGFNNHGFDNNLLKAFGVEVPAGKSYDIYEQVIDAAGLSNAPFAARKGYRLDDLTRANGLTRKNDDEGGALAPLLYQRGDHERLYKYCQNDVMMTVEVLTYIVQQKLVCPRSGSVLPVRSPATVLGTTQVGLF
jgi:hypothetical protein